MNSKQSSDHINEGRTNSISSDNENYDAYDDIDGVHIIQVQPKDPGTNLPINLTFNSSHSLFKGFFSISL